MGSCRDVGLPGFRLEPAWPRRHVTDFRHSLLQGTELTASSEELTELAEHPDLEYLLAEGAQLILNRYSVHHVRLM
jgi:hypothetical protein